VGSFVNRESNERFATTRWSMVLGAGGRISRVDARAALEILCETYWPPLYAYLRRCGTAPADAADTVQGFFALLLEREDLATVHPDRGRFRSFLLASLKHFEANKRDIAKALKRGGGRTLLALDVEAAENQYTIEAIDPRTAESLYNRQWALTVLERAKSRLRESYVAAGKLERFDVLLPQLAGDTGKSYHHVAGLLGITEGAVKTAVHRLRREYGDAVRAEIAQTVNSPEDIEPEVAALFDALRR
jgi:DNA-directed RNA polymerase specialized sigma24 family protein